MTNYVYHWKAIYQQQPGSVQNIDGLLSTSDPIIDGDGLRKLRAGICPEGISADDISIDSLTLIAWPGVGT